MQKVLIVEDELLILAVLSRVLADLPIDVTTCSDAAQAHAVLDQEAPDLLVIDIVLGAGCGVALAKCARADSPHLPVIFVTGRVDRPDVLPGHGSVELLKKPFSMTEFVTTVRRLLSC